MNETKLIKLLSTKEIYNKYHKYTSKYINLIEIDSIIKSMEDYFESTDTIDWDIFPTWFLSVKKPGLSDGEARVYDKIFTLIKNEKTEDLSIIEDILDEAISVSYAEEISTAALAIIEGKEGFHMDDIIELVDKYEQSIDIDADLDKDLILSDFEELFDVSKRPKGLNWRLNTLKAALGPIRPGDSIVFAARPDAGKTTMLASEISYMAAQLPADKSVLWISNEEEGHKIKRRIIQAALGVEQSVIESDWVTAKRRYEEAINGFYNKILVYYTPGGTVKDIEALLQRKNVGLIVFDQLRNVRGFHYKDREDLRIGQLFQWARTISKKYEAPVITVHQARGDAEGVKWINMAQLAGSQTDLQGAVDAIITLGRSFDAADDVDTRYLSIPKNKMDDADPSMRNCKEEIKIVGNKARFID